MNSGGRGEGEREREIKRLMELEPSNEVNCHWGRMKTAVRLPTALCRSEALPLGSVWESIENVGSEKMSKMG